MFLLLVKSLKLVSLDVECVWDEVIGEFIGIVFMDYFVIVISRLNNYYSFKMIVKKIGIMFI